MNEIWKAVNGYEGLYEVSNLGRVKSLPRLTTSGVALKSSLSKGYPVIALCKGGSPKTKRIHSLVARAFNGEKENGLMIDHIDNDRSNNICTNLRYVTNRQNSIYGKRCILNINKSSKYVGVSKIGGRIWSMKMFKGKQYNLGSFNSEEDASIAYKKATYETCVELQELRFSKMSSIHKGIYYDKTRCKWVARFKGEFLGRFTGELEAVDFLSNHKLCYLNNEVLK